MVINMRRKYKGFILACAAWTIFLSACGSTAIPDMTEEQNEQVVEYAAGLLLKYDENKHSRLMEREEEAVQEEPVEVQTPEPESKPEELPQAAEEPEVVDVSEPAAAEEKSRSIEEFYGLEGVEIKYTGFELKDSYPDESSDELILAMQATKGCKLLVLHFEVNNVSGQDVNLDMVSAGAKFKISINGEPPKYALTTMLLNDLGSYKGTIAAGEYANLVLMSEITEEKASGIQSVSLSMKNAAEDADALLN